ncbi:MAG: M20/M25/M40 family metallo-hydrolase [Aggregatilineales bacterium]
MNKNTRNAFFFILWMSLSALACNLSNNPSSRPPTLVPAPPGVTPQATIGYATPSANGQIPVNGNTNVNNSVDVELYNLTSQVQADNLMSHIYALEGFYTRHVNSSQTDPNRGIGAARNYIHNQFLTLSANSNGNFTTFLQQVQTDHNGQRTLQYNVVGVLNGTEAGAGIIVVGAHYDSRTDDPTDAVGFAPGADDNGSGVAAVIELARILGRNPMRSTVIFVLFTSEEVGRQGSREFVSQYINGLGLGDQVTAMLNLDTIGSVNSSTGAINDTQIRVFSDADNNSASRQLAREIELIGINYQLDLEINLQLQRDRDGRYGDHFSFIEQGYPAVRFIEALEDNYNREGRDTRDLVEPYYLVKSTSTILSIIKVLGDGPRPPRQLVMRESGTTDEQGNRQFTLIWDQVPGATSYMVALRRAGSPQYDQMFAWAENAIDNWSGFSGYEAVVVASVDENGLIGPVSQEYLIRGN